MMVPYQDPMMQQNQQQQQLVPYDPNIHDQTHQMVLYDPTSGGYFV